MYDLIMHLVHSVQHVSYPAINLLSILVSTILGGSKPNKDCYSRTVAIFIKKQLTVKSNSW